MFKNKYRIHSAWAKGLMLGKAVGARDERDRIIDLLENHYDSIFDYLGMDYGIEQADILIEILELIKGENND
jgi:hypothetical protein